MSVSSILVIYFFMNRAALAAVHPQITPPPDVERRSITDPAFEGYTSDFGSWSAIFCPYGSTFQTFGTIADCCTTDGTCNPATECFADQIVFYEGGSASTCFEDCSTGYIYKTSGDPSPQSMYGCFDPFELYRTIDNAAVLAAAQSTIALDASSPSSTLAYSAPSSTSSTAGPSHIRPVIIAVAVIVVVLLLAAVTGLVTWIIILKRRQQKQTVPTELRPMPSAMNDSNFEMKAELPAKEISTAELPPPFTDVKSPWSTTASPIEQGQEMWKKHGHQPIAMELPAYQMKGRYQELPG